MADLQTLVAQADAGDPAAQYAVGNAYHLGLGGLEQHLPTAMRWYLKAASQGHIDAQVNLGMIFAQDLSRAGGKSNPEQAKHWFGRAAEQGDGQAMFFLGQQMLEGNPTPANLHQGQLWLEKAGDSGFAPAYNELGLVYLRGELVPEDAPRAAAAFERGAKLGDMHAQFNLAGCLLAGRGVAPDQDQAIYWYRAAADQGLGEAHYNLALLLLPSEDEKKNKEALHFLAKAADKGVAQAQYEIAKRLRIGDGLPADPLQAMHYYHEAAAQGHVEAQFSLALMLEVGMGLDRPYPDQAAQWYQRLVEQAHHAGAAHNLGILCAQGNGVGQDGQRACELFERAIAWGSTDAMYSLGLLLLRGDLVPQDLVEATKWALLSVRHDTGPEAQKLVEIAMQHASPEQVSEARKRAKRWKAG